MGLASTAIEPRLGPNLVTQVEDAIFAVGHPDIVASCATELLLCVFLGGIRKEPDTKTVFLRRLERESLRRRIVVTEAYIKLTLLVLQRPIKQISLFPYASDSPNELTLGSSDKY